MMENMEFREVETGGLFLWQNTFWRKVDADTAIAFSCTCSNSIKREEDVCWLDYDAMREFITDAGFCRSMEVAEI